ncbi:AEC family transporter [Parvibium lacunae]|uniref:AEC family transporter n=1 Tax=Parvibium lacunae TaxID=1888893 RepID=A0A368L0N7_9BURK|nr:AEC family transporter [Parvibium lacunae]RCS57005.1 AEC family transporter [Parvibium lacunae]
MVGQIITIIAPVLSLILLGLLYAWRYRPDPTWANRMNMEVFLPALIFHAMLTRQFDWYSDSWLVLGTVLIVIGSGLLAFPLTRWFGIDSRTFLPSMMFNNCGNMGLPLALFAFGAQDLSNAVIVFVTTNLLFFTLGAWLIVRQTDWRSTILSPMVWATILGALLGAAQIALPAIVMMPLKLLADISLPLLLFTLGVRMLEVRSADWKVGVLGAIVCPLTGLLIALLIVPLLPLTASQKGLLYLFGVLPPAIVNYLLAEKYQQEPAKVAAMVLVGNMASCLFIPLGLFLAFYG